MVRSGSKGNRVDFRWLKASFSMTAAEQRFLAAILAIALIGLVARYVYLRTEKPEAYDAGDMPAEYRGGP